MTEDLEADGAPAPRLSMAPGTSALAPELWQAVLDGWDEPKRHEALLLHCQTSAQLAAAASNYRSVLDDPVRKALAETQLRRIAATAMAKMDVSRATETAPSKSRLVWQVLLLIAFAVIAVLLLRQMSAS